ATGVPPVGAGTSSVTVNGTVPPGLVAALAGDRVTVAGTSAAPSTRTVAVRICTPSIAVTVTGTAFCATAVTLTVALVIPFGIVTLATVSAALPEVSVTTVSPCAGPVSVTVSGVGNVGASVVVPTRANDSGGDSVARVGAPATRSAAPRGSSLDAIWRSAR